MGEGKRYIAWSLWIATAATIFIYAFLLIYFQLLSWEGATAFSRPNLVILVISVVVEIGVLWGTVLLGKSVVRSYQRVLENRNAQALGLALTSSATLLSGYDATPETKELIEEAKLKGWLALWVGADLVAILGFALSFVQKNIYYFIPAALIGLVVLLRYRPVFDALQQEAP